MEVVSIYISIGFTLLFYWAIPEMNLFQTIIMFISMAILLELVIIADRIKKGEK